MVKRIDRYHIVKTEENGILLIFNVKGISYEIKISENNLDRMVWITKGIDLRNSK